MGWILINREQHTSFQKKKKKKTTAMMECYDYEYTHIFWKTEIHWFVCHVHASHTINHGKNVLHIKYTLWRRPAAQKKLISPHFIAFFTLSLPLKVKLLQHYIAAKSHFCLKWIPLAYFDTNHQTLFCLLSVKSMKSRWQNETRYQSNLFFFRSQIKTLKINDKCYSLLRFLGLIDFGGGEKSMDREEKKSAVHCMINLSGNNAAVVLEIWKYADKSMILCSKVKNRFLRMCYVHFV